MVQKTDRDDRDTQYDYDDLGRMTAERWLDGQEQTINTIGFTYDEAGQMVAGTRDTYFSNGPQRRRRPTGRRFSVNRF